MGWNRECFHSRLLPKTSVNVKDSRKLGSALGDFGSSKEIAVNAGVKICMGSNVEVELKIVNAMC